MRTSAPRALLGLALIAIVVSGCSDESEQPQSAPESSSDRPVVPVGFNDDFIGTVHGFTTDQKLRLAETAGASMVRTSLDWRSLEPERDQWDESAWSTATELYELAIDRGVRPIFAIGYAPDWARPPGACGPGSGPGLGRCELPPRLSQDPEWAEFAVEVARRFPKAIIEVWNEPNFRPFWRSGPDPHRYAELFVEASGAIGEAVPGTTVLLAGLLNLDRSGQEGSSIGDFLGAVLEARPEIGSQTAGINIHPYPRGTALGPKSDFSRAFDEARSVRDRAGFRSLPLYVTEVGVSTGGGDQLTPRQQAATMRDVFDRVRAMTDVRALLFHRLFSPVGSTDSWELGASWLLPGSYPPPPRPVYCAFVRAAERTYSGC